MVNVMVKEKRLRPTEIGTTAASSKERDMDKEKLPTKDHKALLARSVIKENGITIESMDVEESTSELKELTKKTPSLFESMMDNLKMDGEMGLVF